MTTRTTLGILVAAAAVAASIPSRSAAQAAPPAGRVEALAAAPNRPGTIAALVSRTVWITRDRGNHWSAAAVAPPTPVLEPWDEDFDTALDGDHPVEAPALGQATRWPGGGSRRAASSTTTVAAEPPESPSEEPGDSTDPILAVGDSGRFALHRFGTLIVGAPGSSVVRRLSIPDVRGLVVDGLDRVWIATDDQVLVLGAHTLSPSSAARQTVPGAGRPVAVPGKDIVLVPGRDGAWVLGLPPGAGSMQARLERVPAVEAVAVSRADGSWLFVGQGGLRRRALDGTISEEGAAPHHAIEAALASDGWPRVRTPAGWFERRGLDWTRMEVETLAVDAAGGLWVGSRDSVWPPGSETRYEKAQTDPEDAEAIRRILFSAAERHDADAPPQCRAFPMEPLPSIGFDAAWGRGVLKSRTMGDPVVSERRTTWFFLGLEASWSLDPPSVSSCLVARQRWNDIGRERADRLFSLWRDWRMNRARAESAKSVEALLEADARRRRAEELIRLGSGWTPQPSTDGEGGQDEDAR